MKNSLSMIAFGLLAATSFARAQSPVLLVTPEHFACHVQPADVPEMEEKGQTPYQVHVAGQRGKFDWRLPLYHSNNGFNDIATAQVGHAKADRHGNFVIALTTYELGKVAPASDLVLEVRNQQGDSARCLLAPSANHLADRETASLTAVRAQAR